MHKRLKRNRLKYSDWVSDGISNYFYFPVFTFSVINLSLGAKCFLSPYIWLFTEQPLWRLKVGPCHLGCVSSPTFFISACPYPVWCVWAYLVAQTVKNLPAVQETGVRSLGWEDPLEKGMVTHSSVLAWRIPWTEEPGGLYSMGSCRVRHNEHLTLFSLSDVSTPSLPHGVFLLPRWPDDWSPPARPAQLPVWPADQPAGPEAGPRVGASGAVSGALPDRRLPL